MHNNNIVNVAVIGLGYVGLPLAVAIARAGYSVIGIDLDTEKVSRINLGISPIEDVASSELQNLVEEGRIIATADYASVAISQVVIICVPTPLNHMHQPDLSCINRAIEEITRYMVPGLMISLESTTYPGTTREVILPIVEKAGFKISRDFYLCFSPERVDPTRNDWKTDNTPKVIGGITPLCLERGKAFYSSFLKTVVPVSSTDAAEMTKILENSFRAVNIAFINEILQVCKTLDLDAWEIIEAASTKPFGFMKFLPGPGVGGALYTSRPALLELEITAAKI